MNDSAQDLHWMRRALELARRGIGVTSPNPAVGCVILDRAGQVVGEGWHEYDLLDHAEIVALREATTHAGDRVHGGTAYVTLEPCAMCAGAMIHARLDRVVYAARDPKAGAAGSVLGVLNHPQLNHQMVVDQGILAEESSELLRSFFRERR